jgi:hypothetical protein
MMKRITFSRAVEVTNPGDDSRSFLFAFLMLDAGLVGAPEQAQQTTEHRLIVTVANNRLPAWHLTEPELVKVLFEIGRRAVVEKVKAGSLAREERVMVHTASHPKICPFDPSRIPEPDGAVFEVEEEKRIGFK